MQLGRKIRDVRLRRGMTVQRLADASGLSKGFVSQIENERTSPSLATLQDIAAALRTPVSYLVAEDEPTPQVVRAAERPLLDIGEDTVRAEVLSALPRRNLELLQLELRPGGVARRAKREPQGERTRPGRSHHRGVGDPVHGSLDDGVLDPQQLAEPGQPHDYLAPPLPWTTTDTVQLGSRALHP